MKHLEVRQEHFAARLFNSLPYGSSGDETLRLMLGILRLLFCRKVCKIQLACTQIYFFFINNIDESR